MLVISKENTLARQKNKLHYVSEIDKFLLDLNQANPTSVSQQQEIIKYRRITSLRDSKGN